MARAAGSWGGKRKGAGRRPNYEVAGESHLARPAFSRRAALHVRIKMRKHVWSLQASRCAGMIETALEAGGDRFGFKIVQPLVRDDHIHLLVEADDEVALGRGMKGLGVRVARTLNRLMERRGKVLDDRYRARVLGGATDVKRLRQAMASGGEGPCPACRAEAT
jgi:hypothetical protein